MLCIRPALVPVLSLQCTGGMMAPSALAALVHTQNVKNKMSRTRHVELCCDSVGRLHARQCWRATIRAPYQQIVPGDVLRQLLSLCAFLSRSLLASRQPACQLRAVFLFLDRRERPLIELRSRPFLLLVRKRAGACGDTHQCSGSALLDVRELGRRLHDGRRIFWGLKRSIQMEV